MLTAMGSLGFLGPFDTGRDFAEDGGDHEKVLVRLRKIIARIAALENAKPQTDTANGAAAEADAPTTGQKVDSARQTESSSAITKAATQPVSKSYCFERRSTS